MSGYNSLGYNRLVALASVACRHLVWLAVTAVNCWTESRWQALSPCGSIYVAGVFCCDAVFSVHVAFIFTSLLVFLLPLSPPR